VRFQSTLLPRNTAPGSLLSKIRRPVPGGGRRPPSANEVRVSVLENLRHLCQTRFGSSTCSPDFGLPDISESLHSFPKTIALLAQALSSAIKKYEPRLKNVRVTHVPSRDAELVLRYEVIAELMDPSGKKSPVAFETRIDASRRISVT
jgi:type VI secretion system protein